MLGICEDMCPIKERELRTISNDLHSYEMIPGTENDPQTSALLAVKKYKRSSANIVGEENDPVESVRPPEVLQRTLNYLLGDILSRTDRPFSDVFAFVRDRTRAIHKDLTLQNACSPLSVDLLERIARLYICADHRLCTEDMEQNMEQLDKTLISLIEMYDDLAYDGVSCPNEAEFRSYYVVKRFRSHLLLHFYELPADIRDSTECQLVYEAWTSSESCFSQFFDVLKKCPYLLSCMLHRHLNEVRLRGLKFMTKYIRGSVPLSYLESLFAFEDRNDLLSFLQHYSLWDVEDEDHLVCRKQEFDKDTPKVSRIVSVKWIERKVSTLSITQIVNASNPSISSSWSYSAEYIYRRVTGQPLSNSIPKVILHPTQYNEYGYKVFSTPVPVMNNNSIPKMEMKKNIKEEKKEDKKEEKKIEKIEIAPMILPTFSITKENQSFLTSNATFHLNTIPFQIPDLISFSFPFQNPVSFPSHDPLMKNDHNRIEEKKKIIKKKKKSMLKFQIPFNVLYPKTNDIAKLDGNVLGNFPSPILISSSNRLSSFLN